ncbi:MAG: RNA polymerase sigma factor [Gemmatimonadota bacterium]
MPTQAAVRQAQVPQTPETEEASAVRRRGERNNAQSEPAAPAGAGTVPARRLMTRAQLQQLDDAGIVEAFLNGDERGFQELVDRYQSRLLNFVYRIVGDRERAEDLVQEAFIRVYRHIRRFDPSKKFSTWIYTIAANLSKNELRNRARNPLVLFQTIRSQWKDEDRPLQFEDEASRPDDLFRKRHLRELVEASVKAMPRHHREVFVLRELEGKSYEVIAEITSCNLGTVKSRLNRARNAFAAIIEPSLR